MFNPNAPRPPYVEFRRDVIENKNSRGEVNLIEDDFAYITPIGSKDTVVMSAKQWIANQWALVQQERQNPEWVRQWEAAYKAWQQGLELPANGTAVEVCPIYTVSEIKRMRAFQIRTVEDMAAANAEAIHRLGMGAVSLKQRSTDWLTAKSSDSTQLVARLDASERSREQLERQVADLNEKVRILSAAVEQGRGQPAVVGQLPPADPSREPLEMRLASAQAGLPRDNDDALVDNTVDEELK